MLLRHQVEPCRPLPEQLNHLVHLLDESIDVIFSVTKITTFDVVLELARPEATIGVRQLEWPQEVAGLLEVGADGVDLVDQILHAHHAVLAKVVLDELVVGEWDALLVDLAVAALIDELANGLEVGVAEGDVRVDDGEHLRRGFRKADEDTVVDLEETEELEDLARLRSDFVDTLDTDNEDQFGLSRNIERTFLLAQAGQADLLALCFAIFLDIGLGTLEDDPALLLVCLLLLLKLSSASLTSLLLALPLLQEGLRDHDLVIGWNGAVAGEKILCQYSPPEVLKDRRVRTAAVAPHSRTVGK